MGSLANDAKYAVKNPREALTWLLSAREKLSYFSDLDEIFLQQVYLWLISDLRRGTVAIDIGSYKGESSIYLAMSERITKVIGVEPLRDAFLEAKKRVRASRLGDKIELINNAVWGSRERMINTYTGASSLNTVEKSTRGKKAITIGQLTARTRSKNIIIKCNAEGAETEIFNCNASALRRVYKMQIQYHDTYAKLNRLVRKLGFKTKRVGDLKSIMYYKRIGWLYAWR